MSAPSPQFGAYSVFEPPHITGECGISFIADKEGRSHLATKDLLKALACNKHRGGKDALQTSSDGVGLTTEIPWKMFNGILDKEFSLRREEGQYAAGVLFIPKDDKLRTVALGVLKSALRDEGLQLIATRKIPVNLDATGAEARKSLGQPTHIFVDKPAHLSEAEFNAKLYSVAANLAKKRKDRQLSINDLCLVSLDTRTITHKALCKAEDFGDFFPDFNNPDFETSYGLGHVRFSTRTKSMPPSAQPVSGYGTVILAHNGEMNNYIGAAGAFEQYMHERGHTDFYFPEGISDSNMFSMALEALMRVEGWSLPAAMLMLNPPPINDVPEEFQPMVKYFTQFHKPWRGPANLVAIGEAELEDGRRAQIVLGHGDAGLQRPAAVSDSTDKFYLGSEDGVVNVEMNADLRKDALRSGDFVGFIMDEKRRLSRDEILRMIRAEGIKKIGHSFEEALSDIELHLPKTITTQNRVEFDASLNGKRNAVMNIYGWGDESLRYYLAPMMFKGMDNTIAMGYDVAEPEFHHDVPPLHFMTKHRFNQITSSVIDAKREKKYMPLDCDLGADSAIVEGARKIHLNSPILREGQLAHIEEICKADGNIKSARVDFTRNAAQESLQQALVRIADQAEALVREGHSIIILSDINISATNSVVPAFLATAAVNERLKEKNISRKASIVVQTGQVYDLHHAAILTAQGATAVDAIMLPVIADQLTNSGKKNHRVDATQELSRDELLTNAYNAMDFGIQTIMAKVGVDDFRGYQGASLLEVDGLNLNPQTQPDLHRLFSGVAFLKGSIGMDELDAAYRGFHQNAIKPGHVSQLRREGQMEQPAEATSPPHINGSDLELPAFRTMLGAFDQARLENNQDKVSAVIASGGGQSEQIQAVRLMDSAVKEAIIEGRPLTGIITPEYIRNFHTTPQYAAFRAYSDKVEKNRKINPKLISDVLEIDASGQTTIPLEEVEPVDMILSRMFASDMSFGALTKRAHTWIDASLNMLRDTLNNGQGPHSTSGEGGIPRDLIGTVYQPRRFQVGTAQFGLTADTLASIDRIIFKAAQGAKPGLGGELPGPKVEVSIAFNRGSMPWAGLSSPPSHDDVKSIEDWTLKCLALRAAGVPVDIKLVSALDIGTTAMGVQKAMLASGAEKDGKTGTITISGAVGGTGASPATASAHSGMDAFKGLRLADRGLRSSGLRDPSHLTSDGGINTGVEGLRRMLAGADSFGFGTVLMQAVGCVMIRQCNIACAAGVATNQELFSGAVDNVVDFVLGMAHEIRENMARLGVKTMDELVGHTELLKVNTDHIASSNIKKRFDPTAIEELLAQEPNIPLPEETRLALHEPVEYVDDRFVAEVLEFYTAKQTANEQQQLVLNGESTNCDLSIGGKLAVQIAKHKLARKTELFSRGMAETDVLEKLHQEYGEYDQVVFKIKGRTGQEKDGEQNFGAAGQYAGFLVSNGLTIEFTGMAHDSCASGLGVGGVVIVKPPHIEGYQSEQNNIVKNHALLSATGGKFFAAGTAGRNFAARNGGASAVVEGVGDYACKFMGSGTVINLGGYGRGLCSQMAGGVFIQYDKDHNLSKNIDPAMSVMPLAEFPEQEQVIKDLLQEHVARTGSTYATKILANWQQEMINFKVAVPREIMQRKDAQLEDVRTVLSIRQGEDGPNAVSAGEHVLAQKLWAKDIESQTLTSTGLGIKQAVRR